MRCVRALLHDRAGLACLLFLGAVLLAACLLYTSGRYVIKGIGNIVVAVDYKCMVHVGLLGVGYLLPF